MESTSHRPPRKNHNKQFRKKPAIKVSTKQNDIYVTKKSSFKYQQKQCEDLINSGVKDIYLHCLGNAIQRGLNLSLHLVNNSSNALSYAINTSTIHLVDELHPLFDEDDIAFQRRNNSAIHIRISRTAFVDVDTALKD